MSSAGIPSTASTQTPSRKSRLSCRRCQERKIKCDKLAPCSNCIKARSECITANRKRLSRGWHVTSAQNKELKERLARVEALLSSAPNAVDSSSRASNAPGTSSGSETVSVASPGLGLPKGRMMAKGVWMDLVNEVQGLRDALYDESDDETVREVDGDWRDDYKKPNSFAAIVGMPGSSLSKGYYDSITHSHSVRMELCRVYLQQVDPIVKILHRPSVMKLMCAGGSYLDRPQGSGMVEALEAAICYAAVRSMSTDQIDSLFQQPKPAVMALFRSYCEDCFNHTSLVLSNDIVSLQALVIYLFAAKDQTKFAGIMISVAGRMSLPPAMAGRLMQPHRLPGETVLQFEERKRIYYALSTLDGCMVFETASMMAMIMNPNAATLDLPSNVNDDDISQSMTTFDLPSYQGVTDTTVSLLSSKYQAAFKQLNFDIPGNRKDDVSWRSSVAQAFDSYADQLTETVDPESSPIAAYATTLCQVYKAAVKLSLDKPIYVSCLPKKHTPSLAPRETLTLALHILRLTTALRTTPAYQGWAWFELSQWHALAIAIKEAYSCPDVRLVLSLWPTVEASYAEFALVAPDTKDGKMWRPMKRVMRGARLHIARLQEQAAAGPTVDESFSFSFAEASMADMQLGGVDAQTRDVEASTDDVMARLFPDLFGLGEGLDCF